MRTRFAPVVALWSILMVGCGQDEPIMDLESRIDATLSQMTLAEKVEQMHGSSFLPIEGGLYPTADNDRLGIPGFRMVDGPRGVRAGTATTFPVSMARGASWDPELERAIGAAIGLEASAKGANVILAPTVNLLRHPAWGRAQETYGEDPLLLGALGAAFVEGAQQHVIASVKHFAANSIEDTRFEVDVSIDERTLREVYLPHFHRIVKQARVDSVMSAYNKLNGSYCGENSRLLREILKDEWGFDGFVESDWILGTRSTVKAALAGLDIEMPTGSFYGDKLLQAVEGGEVPESVIDDSVRRILRKKLEHALHRPPRADPSVVESPEHAALALRAAEQSIVLLANDGSLPLGAPGSIAVVGRLADVANLGDRGSSNSVPSRAVTPLDGIRSRAGSALVVHIPGPELTAADQAAIAAADVAIVVAGLTAKEEGENLPTSGGDRDTLELPAEQQALILAVAQLSPRTVVVLEGGSAITLRGWLDQVEAVLMAWYPGQEGGTAIAEILFGDVNPSGRLPLTIPVSESDLPPFDHTSVAVGYDAFHGYRKLDRDGIAPELPFGFGLSYTTFAYSGLRIEPDRVAPDAGLRARVEVSNTGQRAGDEVVQLYVSYPEPAVERPLRTLQAFRRVHLEAGETRSVELELEARDLAYYDAPAAAWRVEEVGYVAHAGSSSRDLPVSATFRIGR